MGKKRISDRIGFICILLSHPLLSLCLMDRTGASPVSNTSSSTDMSALMSFITGLEAAPRVNWPLNVSICKWQGVVCNANRRVEALHLPAVGLSGRIPDGVLSKLSELRVLSLRSNKLSGPLPDDISNCTQLRSLYLQQNSFSGRLPSLSALPPLIRLNLAYNKFTDAIPPSYALLHRLGTLYLQNNSLSGALPDFLSLLPNLVQFSVAGNTFNGSLPTSLQNKFDATSFQGNNFCGPPLFKPCSASPPISPPAEAIAQGQDTRSEHGHKLSKGYIVIAAVAAVFAVLMLASFIAWFIKKNKGSPRMSVLPNRRSFLQTGRTMSVQKGVSGESSGKSDLGAASSTTELEMNKLIFFDGVRSTFDLEDLLRASAEVLGKGSIGTSYKAVLDDSTTVVVKRLRDVNVVRKEFEQLVGSLGKLRDRHLVPLHGYYYSRDEKLLLLEYMPLGSLSALLHGNKASGKTPLDWDTRVKIAADVAKGIAFLHRVGGGIHFIHGNVKSSNVLLSRNYKARISDYGLAGLSSSSPVPSRILGYHAPEVLETRSVTSKGDVYSYGVLLLELLTGKVPSQTSSDEAVDLPRWVQSIVQEEWTAEVFDEQLIRHGNAEDEMVQILQIAMACVAASPAQRPTMHQVVEMLEAAHVFEASDIE
ncbi:hypothetical protein KP509_06G026600 [Ceratopteris richardii]|uniref:Protein kinase domain-containing protein n=1 Tax=Ceratopteris richardii TaxID=49495 RepID=A0A8T2UM84_CERRI|nr:hypothetical protein KP509_06G026600 [Ceratopteris richardii]